MTTAATITQLASLVMAADRSADDAERDLGAAMADLNAAHLREAALAGELIAARKALASQPAPVSRWELRLPAPDDEPDDDADEPEERL